MQEFLTRWMAPLALLLSAFLLVAAAASAQVEPPRKSPFGTSVAQPAVPAAQAATQTWWGQVVVMQQSFVRSMAQQIKALKSSDPITAAMTLASLSFLYGVLHAAGPGHGKAVISSYVLANRDTARRGIALSFLAAFFQACSAILFVWLLALLLKTSMANMKSAEAFIERASWVFVIGIGGWLLWRQIRPMLATGASAADGHGHAHAHAHRNVASQAAHRHADGSLCTHDHGHDHGHHAHHHADGGACRHANEAGHVHGPDCGHAHMPDPKELDGPWSWRRALAISLGIGIRPCSGAILLMIFALSQGLLWAGVFATFMMSLGTAITVSVLAVLAVTSRDIALRVTGGTDSRWGRAIATGVGVIAAIIVIGIGIAGLTYPTPEPLFTTR